MYCNEVEYLKRQFSNLGRQALIVIEKYPGNYGNGVKILFVWKKTNEVLQHAFFADEFS